MKWIKASEQLPEKRDRYYVKLDGRSKELIFFNGKRFETYEWITHDAIEWLDDKPEDEELVKASGLFEDVVSEVNNEYNLLSEQMEDLKSKYLILEHENNKLQKELDHCRAIAKRMFL